MFAVVGVLLLGGSVLLFAQTLLARRNPDTPAWAMRGWTVEAATWTAVIGFFAGVSLMAQAVAEPAFGWIEAGIVVVMLAAFAILWSRMRVGKRLAEYKAMTAASQAKPAGTSKTMAGTGEGPAPKPAPGAGGGSGRKAA